jgi:CIC family chloride channel protein
MVGGAVGFGIHSLDPNLVSNPGSYVLVGMGAFFAGAAKAPLAGLIMVCEITGNYGLLPPLLIASTLHLTLSRKWSLYDSQRHDKFASPVHEHALNVDVLRHATLPDVFHAGAPFIAFGQGTSVAEAFARMAGSDQHVFPVLDKDGMVEGLVTASSLHLAVMGDPDGSFILEDVMGEAHALESGMTLKDALSAFLSSGAGQLPVLDEEGAVVGMLRMHDIMAHYDRVTRNAVQRDPALQKNPARSEAV